ncbi:amidase [Flammeovirga agarivorans]|uniref:Amidase n=1 Tax=Flammeovirga agarivorans TaxID=2726742 RepID=A0A7X8SQJ9_9BACT|nr:amidase [Flammeovirga agarivorans]NLR94478.1 amidase [Flammeovirga agarivorans]
MKSYFINLRIFLITITLLFANLTYAQNSKYSQEELAFMPASSLLELYKQLAVSPVDVVEAQKAQWEKTNGEVNATTFTYWDKALAQAEIAEQHYKDGTYRSLEGITVGLKDEHHDVGMRVTQGSLVHRNDPPKDYADPVTQKLKDAGAIFTIQCTVPELYLHFCTDTRAWGTTRNPWNNKYSVGGSSGGSGAALAAGYCTIATGSDMGGSVRIPSAFNGVYGLKPSFGTVHTDLPMSYFSGTGPMARTFEDMAMMYNVIAGPTPYSPNVMAHQQLPTNYESLEGVKVAYVLGLGILEPTNEVKTAMNNAIEALKKSGAQVDIIEIDFGMDAKELLTNFKKMAFAGPMGGQMSVYETYQDSLTKYASNFVDAAANAGYNGKDLAEVELLIKKMYHLLAEATFENGYEAVILPTLPTSHIPADFDLVDGTVEEDGRVFPGIVGGAYTIPFNLLNYCPVASVPVGLSSQNMPIGMQIVGKPYDIESVFKVAYNYSQKGIKLFEGNNTPSKKMSK